MESYSLVHVANLMFAAAYLVRGILWLRILSVFGCGFMVFYLYFAPETPLWGGICWNIFFIVVNVLRIWMLYKESQAAVSFSDIEKELYNLAFKKCSAFEFMKLLRIAQWRSYSDGERLTEEGQAPEKVILIYDGAVNVHKGGTRIANLTSGAFLGEMAYVSGQPATATASAAKEVTALEWPIIELKKLLDRNDSLKNSFATILGIDMAVKLQSRDPQRPAAGETGS